MKKIRIQLNIIIGIVFTLCVFRNYFTVLAFNWANDYDPVSDAYKFGEPNYGDGDLEDKLGDSGYYYDMFPEERDGEPDDYEKGIIGWNYDGDPIYKNNNSGKKKTDYNNPIVDHVTNASGPVTIRKDTIIDGATVYPVGSVADILVIGNRVYYRYKDGIFHKGWLKVGNSWYYFDPDTLGLVFNQLKEIDGLIYYFDSYGVMASNTIMEIANCKIQIDSNGACKVID